MRVYGHAECEENCKDFTFALKIFDVFYKKQVYDSVITGEENTSKDWNCIVSMLLTHFNICFVFVDAYFMCICLKTTVWHFMAFCGTRSLFW